VKPDNPAHPLALKAMEGTAHLLEVDVQAVEVRRPDEFAGARSWRGERCVRRSEVDPVDRRLVLREAWFVHWQAERAR